jgi:hypothetical protein
MMETLRTLKLRSTSTTLHVAIFQKAVIFIFEFISEVTTAL